MIGPLRMTYMVADKAKWRAKVVTFFEKYGKEATEESFGIKTINPKYPRLGKNKIKLFLDEFCLKNNLNTISQSTIGRIIKKKNLFFRPKKIIYFGKLVKTQY